MCRRRCWPMPCCTTPQPGPVRRLPWGCSSPCASTTRLCGCAPVFLHRRLQLRCCRQIAFGTASSYKKAFLSEHCRFAPCASAAHQTSLVHVVPRAIALLLQMTLDWGPQQSGPPTSPMALLSAIVRKEALLPEHTAEFAATQLLPVIQAATERHLASLQGQPFGLQFCRELLVSAEMTPIVVLRKSHCIREHAAIDTCQMHCRSMHELCVFHTALSVCGTGDVFLPDNQLCMARAAGASALAKTGSKHGACHLERRSPFNSSTVSAHTLLMTTCICAQSIH